VSSPTREHYFHLLPGNVCQELENDLICGPVVMFERPNPGERLEEKVEGLGPGHTTSRRPLRRIQKHFWGCHTVSKLRRVRNFHDADVDVN
jgi:hypothetical protein